MNKYFFIQFEYICEYDYTNIFDFAFTLILLYPKKKDLIIWKSS